MVADATCGTEMHPKIDDEMLVVECIKEKVGIGLFEKMGFIEMEVLGIVYDFIVGKDKEKPVELGHELACNDESAPLRNNICAASVAQEDKHALFVDFEIETLGIGIVGDHGVVEGGSAIGVDVAIGVNEVTLFDLPHGSVEREKRYERVGVSAGGFEFDTAAYIWYSYVGFLKPEFRFEQVANAGGAFAESRDKTFVANSFEVFCKVVQFHLCVF